MLIEFSGKVDISFEYYSKEVDFELIDINDNNGIFTFEYYIEGQRKIKKISMEDIGRWLKYKKVKAISQ